MLRPLLLVTFVLGWMGCSPSAPIPPVIDTLDMPPTAIIDAMSNSYVVSGNLVFHDDDDVVQTLRITIPLDSSQHEYPIGLFNGSVGVTVRFGAQTPKGPQQYIITLLDASGTTAVQTKTVTLE